MFARPPGAVGAGFSFLCMRYFPLLAGLCLLAACNSEPQEQKTKSGFKYKLLKDESGATVQPGEGGSYFVSVYKNDSLLQSSRDVSPEPQVFLLPNAAALEAATEPDLLSEVMQLLSVGDSASILLPMDTIKQRPPGFDSTDILRYDFVLTRIMDSTTFQQEEKVKSDKLAAELAAYQSRQEPVADSVATLLAEYKKGGDAAGYTTTDNGLKYKVLEEGTGARPEPGQPVTVSYYGVLVSDGEMFDNSFRAGKAFDFPLGQGYVIPGWDEGIALLEEGSRAVLAIPSELAYGDNPQPGSPIPAGAELMFYVQLQEVGDAPVQ